MSKKGFKKRILAIMMAVCMVCSMVPSTAVVQAATADKTLTVNGSATEQEGATYTTIQDAINYINEQTDTDKTGWTITVEEGTYSRFTVLAGLDGLTVQEADGATVVISTMDGSTNPVGTNGAYPETGGISIRDAQNVTLDGLTINMGTTKSSRLAAGVSNYTETKEKGNNFTITNCTFQGSGTGYAIFVNTGTTQFNVTNCTFDSVYDGIEMYGDGTLMLGATVTGNTFTNCAFAMHGYYGGTGDAGTLTFANNTVTGTSDLRCKVVVQDQSNTGAIKVDIKDNTFTYALVGLVNLQEDGETVSDVLSSNTFDDGSFYVEAVEPGSVTVTYTSYQAPSDDEGYWVLTGIENNELISYNSSVDADIIAAIQEAIDEANITGSKTLNITSVDVDGDGEVDEDELIRTFTWCKDCVYWTSTDDTDTDWETSKSKEATNLDENYESDVTLSLPSAEEELVYDIVFVLDKSTSTDTEQDILDMLQTLKEQIEETNASINVGVVIFNREANVVCELTDLATGYDTIEEAVQTTITSGTNLHAGLLAGKQMLDDDTSVDASRKYLIVVSDGITYMYDEDAKISTYYWYNDNRPYYSTDNYAWQFKYGDNEVPEDWDAWIEQIGTILETEEESETLYSNRSSLTTETATDASNLAEDEYTTNVDRALYYSYQTYAAAEEAGYTCFAVMKETTTEYAWGPSFINYLAGGETVDFSTIEQQIIYLLDAGSKVKDVMGYGTDSEGNEYDFDFIDDASRITLTVGETTYTTSVSTEELDENETSRYIFTADGVEATNGAEAPFVLHYYANGMDGQSDECFVWDINVPVSNFQQVQLTYGVVLTNPQTEDATYGTYDQYGDNNDGDAGYSLYTNDKATLWPVDTEGNRYPPEDFQEPTVSYEIISVTVSKTWDDADDQDAVRPESITVNLLADGEVIDSAVLSEDNDWTYEFTGLRQWDDDDEGYEPIEYTVTETSVDGYTTTITGDTTDGFVVTNSHEAETTEVTVTKVWDDADDQDGKRPTSVTINLLADGEIIDYISLTEEGDWTYTFTDLDKYADGVEIEYTVSENYIDEYESVISGDAETGYVVTNSYEPETINIDVTKIFEQSDKDTDTPAAVTVVLYANGESTGKTITLSEGNNWYGTFTDLAKYADGEEIEYTIKEKTTAGDISIVTGSDSEGFTITTYTKTSSNSGSSTTTSSTADEETEETTSESSGKTTELTTGTSEDGSVSTTSVEGETENNSISWIIPVAGVGVVAVIGAVIYLKKREEVTE